MSQIIQNVSWKQYLPKWAYNQQWLLIINLEEGEIKTMHDMVNLYIHPIIWILFYFLKKRHDQGNMHVATLTPW